LIRGRLTLWTGNCGKGGPAVCVSRGCLVERPHFTSHHGLALQALHAEFI
jgi:hypothetical protein